MFRPVIEDSDTVKAAISPERLSKGSDLVEHAMVFAKLYCNLLLQARPKQE